MANESLSNVTLLDDLSGPADTQSNYYYYYPLEYYYQNSFSGFPPDYYYNMFEYKASIAVSKYSPPAIFVMGFIGKKNIFYFIFVQDGAKRTRVIIWKFYFFHFCASQTLH